MEVATNATTTGADKAFRAARALIGRLEFCAFVTIWKADREDAGKRSAPDCAEKILQMVDDRVCGAAGAENKDRDELMSSIDAECSKGAGNWLLQGASAAGVGALQREYPGTFGQLSQKSEEWTRGRETFSCIARRVLKKEEKKRKEMRIVHHLSQIDGSRRRTPLQLRTCNLEDPICTAALVLFECVREPKREPVSPCEVIEVWDD